MRMLLGLLIAASVLAACGRQTPALPDATTAGAPVPTATATRSTAVPAPAASPPPTVSPSPRPAPTINSTPPPSGTTTVAAILSGGEVRSYRIHVSARYRPGVSTPLVINLHGLGSGALEQEGLSGMSTKADREGFVVVYPEGRGGAWGVGPAAESAQDRQFMLDLVRTVSAQLSIDPKRIYATGMSNGGGMANRLACDLANTFAAIAPVAGAYNFWEFCAPSRAVPVMAFHGMADLLVPYGGSRIGLVFPPIREWAQTWAQRDQCAANPASAKPHPDVTIETWTECAGGAQVVLLTIANHGHSWPGSRYLPALTSQAVNATDAIWEFFKKHQLP